MLSQKEFVEGCYNWYREADLQPGNPEDGDWDEAHYPVPKCKDGTETILLLKGHHAIQGVIQCEEYQWVCIFGWEKEYLSGEYLELYYKWKSEGMKLIWASKTEEEKILWSEKMRDTHAQMPEEKKVLKAKKCRANAISQWDRLTEEDRVQVSERMSSAACTRQAQMTEEKKILRAERLRARSLASQARMTEEKKILRAEKLRANAIAQHARRRERQAQELLARWKEGVVRECIL